MIEVNYPKKYALIELKEYTGYCEEFGMRLIKTYAYIVGECYLVNKISVTKENGRIREYYEVVFIKTPNSNYENIPRYYLNGNCYNSNIVDKVFDNIEDAIKYRDDRNIMLMAKCIYNSQEKNISKIKMEFLEKLEDVYKLEENLGENDIKKKIKSLRY